MEFKGADLLQNRESGDPFGTASGVSEGLAERAGSIELLKASSLFGREVQSLADCLQTWLNRWESIQVWQQGLEELFDGPVPRETLLDQLKGFDSGGSRQAFPWQFGLHSITPVRPREASQHLLSGEALEGVQKLCGRNELEREERDRFRAVFLMDSFFDLCDRLR